MQHQKDSSWFMDGVGAADKRIAENRLQCDRFVQGWEKTERRDSGA